VQHLLRKEVYACNVRAWSHAHKVCAITMSAPVEMLQVCVQHLLEGGANGRTIMRRPENDVQVNSIEPSHCAAERYDGLLVCLN
jgi:hypothetical protein